MKMERKGFTLIELLVVIAIIALLISLLLPALGKWRESGRLLINQINMRELNTASATYATQFADKISSFTWTGGSIPSGEVIGGGILPLPGDDTGAAARQAVNIIRKRTGDETFPIINGWIPHVLYSHLVLQDFIDQRLPAKSVVSPEDRYRLLWQDTQGFRSNSFQPFQEDGTDQTNWRWSFSSSYQFVPASYSPDVGRPGLATVSQGGAHNTYNTPTTPGLLGKRKSSDVVYPSQKVFLFDGQARHKFGQKREYHYTYPLSKQPLQMFDGSNNLVTTNRTTLGGNPNGYSTSTPGNWAPQLIEYDPRTWEAPDDGIAATARMGRFQWTWGGLKGVDVPNLRPDAEVITTPAADANFRARGPF
jgi:prepilin-type N-terminal cleavage/methylation domain-containing protein